jgi:hypothetical protein
LIEEPNAKCWFIWHHHPTPYLVVDRQLSEFGMVSLILARPTTVGRHGPNPSLNIAVVGSRDSLPSTAFWGIHPFGVLELFCFSVLCGVVVIVANSGSIA